MCVSVAIRIPTSCRIRPQRSPGTLLPDFTACAIDRLLGHPVLRARARAYPGPVTAGGRTYQIRTYGCQMNAHDSERLAGLLDDAGYQPAGGGGTPDAG